MPDTPLHCRHPRELDIEGEIAIAESARAEGDWKHALHHYVNALGMDPLAIQASTALLRLHAEHDVLGTLRDSDFVGAHVARAHLLANAGEREEALAVMAQVDVALPELGAVRLLTEWFDPASVSAEGRRALYGPLGGAATIGVGRVRLLPGEHAAVAPYADLAARLGEVEDVAPALELVSGILRRAERYPEAIAAGEKARAIGGPTSSIALALAHRVSGNRERAAELFEEIFTLTGDATFLAEQARALADAQAWSAARERMEQWAEQTGAPEDVEIGIFREWIDACAAGDPVALGRDYDWVRRTAISQGVILPMSDASTNVLDQPDIPRGAEVKVEVTNLEAPSARLCLALHAGAGPNPGAVTYRFRSVPEPDPRLPRQEVQTLLWVERDGVMVQAVDPPPDDIRTWVAEVTTAGTDLFTVWDAAERHAVNVRERLDEVVSAMVFPPDPPDDEASIPWWVHRCQVAAACMVARTDTRWAGERRRILLDLIYGPADWTTAAAVLVLGEIAVREPDALDEIRRELHALADAIPTSGHCAYAPTLALTAAKIPFFRHELARTLQATWLTETEEGHEEQDESQAVKPKRPWWKFWG